MKAKVQEKLKITTQELSAKLWIDVEALFGAKGACDGRWCMFWRTVGGEKWEDIKGREAKNRLKRGIAKGEIQGALAYVNGEPVGWCSFGPRKSFAKLDRAPGFRCEGTKKVWSVPSFFVKPGFREKGVGRALLTQALASLKKQEAAIVEGYPVKRPKNGIYVPSFSWNGTASLFEKAGFEATGKRDAGKVRMRLGPL